MQKIIVLVCVPLLIWSSYRLFTYRKGADGRQEALVDVFRCVEENKEYPYPAEEISRCYREKKVRFEGDSAYFECPGCGKLSLLYDQNASINRSSDKATRARIQGPRPE